MDRTNVTDKGYTYGGKDYTYETRYDFNNQPYQVALPQAPKAPTTSPTVVSNYNTQKKVNDITSTFQNNVNTQVPSFPTGTSRAVYAPSGDGQTGQFLGYARTPQEEESLMLSFTQPTTGGQAFTAPQGATLQADGNYLYNGQYYTKDQLSSPESVAAIQNTALQRKKYDDALQSELDAINKRYDNYLRQQQAITESGAAGARNALLQSGAGGRGSVAQYAAVTADARVNGILQEGQQALADLDAKREQLLSAAKIAYQDKDYELLSRLNTQIETNRKDMLEVARKKNEEIEKETKQANLDYAVSELYSLGTNDTASIVKALRQRGITATAKDVDATLKNIVPEGLDDLMKTLRTNGAPQDVIQKVMSSTNMGDAYKAAGNYAAGGTGIIGEYNFYRAQAEAQGQTPVDFNTYQNMDANRKAKVAAAGVSGVGGVSTTGQPLVKVSPKEIQDLNETESAKNSLVSLVDSMISSIDKYGTQVLLGKEAGARDAVKTNLLLAMKNLEKTGALDKGTIDVLEGTIPTSKFFATEDAQIASLNKLKETIVNKVSEYQRSYIGTTAEVDPRTKRIFEEKTGDIIIKNEEQAKQEMNKVFPTLSPEYQSAVKTLYESDYTDGQVYEYLQTIGAI